jgi:hypothetical protein
VGSPGRLSPSLEWGRLPQLLAGGSGFGRGSITAASTSGFKPKMDRDRGHHVSMGTAHCDAREVPQPSLFVRARLQERLPKGERLAEKVSG